MLIHWQALAYLASSQHQLYRAYKHNQAPGNALLL
jgi:hypothetical protein